MVTLRIKIFLTILMYLSGFFFLCSCAPVKKDIVISRGYEIPKSERISKIPLKVALYLSPSFRSYAIKEFGPHNIRGQRNDPSLMSIRVHVGEALASGSERMANNLFEEVRIVDSLNLPPNLTRPFDILVSRQLSSVG